METVTKTKKDSPIQERLLVDKAFFGKDNCLNLQVRGKNLFLKWGKKQETEWKWKTVKFSDTEAGEMIAVLEGKMPETSFYHSYNEKNTKIWVSNKESKVVFKADEYVKGLGIGEAGVLKVLLTHSIWMLNLA